VATLPAQEAYLDGELCGVRPDGITSFSLIQNACAESCDRGNAADRNALVPRSKYHEIAQGAAPDDRNPSPSPYLAAAPAPARHRGHRRLSSLINPLWSMKSMA